MDYCDPDTAHDGAKPESVARSTVADTFRGPTERERLDRFLAFANENQGYAIRLATRLLAGDHAGAEDVAQEAFLRAYRGLGRFRGDAKLRTWFTRILVREVQRHRRWQGVHKVWSTLSLSDVDPPEAPPRTDAWELRARLVAALERLSARQREAFVLVHLEQFTVAETADLLGTAPGTIKAHVHRAAKSLRRDLADLKPTGGMS